MKRLFSTTLLGVGLILGCVSCSTRLADLTVASTKNMDLNTPRGYRTSINQRVKGTDKKHIIFFFPTGEPNVKEAIDRAIENGGSDCVALSNATLTQKWFYIPFIYGQVSLEAEGDAIHKN